jgi:hypothetical protein
LNFPYLESKFETPMEESEEVVVEVPALELPETSTSKHSKVNKSSKMIENIKEEISEMKLLERVIKSQN